MRNGLNFAAKVIFLYVKKSQKILSLLKFQILKLILILKIKSLQHFNSRKGISRIQLAIKGNNSKILAIISLRYFWLSGQSLKQSLCKLLATKKKLKQGKLKEFLGNSLP